MSDCPNGEIRDQLPDLLHDRLDAATRRIVEAHVRECAECAEELALLQAVSGALRRVPAVAVGDIVGALPAYRPAVRRSWGGWRVAAAITIIVAGGSSIAIARNARLGERHSGAMVAVAPSAVALVAAARPTDSSGPAATGLPSVSASAPAAPAAGEQRELAVASTTIGDLDDRELSALLQDIESLDAVTPADVEHAAPVSPIAPSPSGAGA
jgi:hypothetical protein